MNNEQIRMLSKIKKLIYQGKKRFILRRDRDYIQELLDIGISEKMAWEEILLLKPQFYFNDNKPMYLKDNKSLIFKKTINEELTYIKLRIEEYGNNEEAVCLSFHRDGG